jgi:hypothetical protein
MSDAKAINAGKELLQSTAKLIQMNAISLAINYGAATSAAYVLSLTDSLQGLSGRILEFMLKDEEGHEHDCERLKTCVKLHKKTQKVEYNGSLYENGVCVFCGKPHFHSTRFIFGSFICPLCNFEFNKILRR